MNYIRKFALTAAVSASLFAVPAFPVAAQQDLRAINTELHQAISFLQEKKYAEACVKLKLLPDLENPSSNPVAAQLQRNIFYIQGQCFAGLGLYEDAKPYFLKIIEQDAEQPRPYLDLAIIYQYLGEFDKAEDIYKQVLELDALDNSVRKKIETIRSVNPKKLNYAVELSAGFLTDNNLTNSPSAESIIIYGQEFFLGQNIQPTEAQGAHAGVNASVNKLLSNTQRLSVKANVNSSTYIDKPDGNTLLVDLLAGYHFKYGHSEYAIEPRFSSVSLGGEALLNIASIGIRYSTFINNNLRITPILEYGSFSYTSDSQRDVSAVTPRVILNYSYDDELMIQGGWSTSIATADNDQNSYDSTQFDLGVRYRVNSNIILSADMVYSTSDYGGSIEAFELKRSDTRSFNNLNASFNLKQFDLPRFTLDIGINQFTNDSNITLYENDRQQIYSYLKYTVF